MTTLRTNVVNEAQYVLAHGAKWEYYEIRPVPVAAIKSWTGRTTIKTDCSGSVIGIYARAGAPDPSGYSYTGSGNTESLYGHCEHLRSYTDAQPGDLIDVGTPSDGGQTHVYLVLRRAGSDLEVFSHGGPLGHPPRTEMLSSVKNYWYSSGHVFTGLRALPLVEKAPKWDVLNGRGDRLAKTNHPVRWAVGHPKSFRKFGQVRFVRRGT